MTRASLLLTASLLAIMPTRAATVEELQAQMNAMKAQFEAQMAAMQAQINSAKDEVASAKKEVAAARSETVAVAKDIAATKKTADETAKAQKRIALSGRMFINASTLTSKTNNKSVDASSKKGLEVKRFYFGVDGKIDDTWSANLTTDFQYDAGAGNTQVFLKKAYLQGKFSDAFVLRIGQADTPWIPFVEGVYGFRYVENTTTDRLKIGSSAAWGVHASGKFADGMVNYAVALLSNANNFRDPNRNDGIDFESRVSFNPVKQVTLGAGFATGKLGKNVRSDLASAENRTATRFNALAAYNDHGLRIGAEYFHAKNWAILSTAAEDKANGWSTFASYTKDKWTGFARYDNAKPNKLTRPDVKDRYMNVGVAYNITKGLDLAFVYKHGKKTDNPLTTAVDDLKTNELGFWALVGF